jgi:hypothetical protein
MRVAAVRAIVAQDEVLASRDGQRFTVDRVAVARAEVDVRLVEGLIIDEDVAALDENVVAGQADDALDQVGFFIRGRRTATSPRWGRPGKGAIDSRSTPLC